MGGLIKQASSKFTCYRDRCPLLSLPSHTYLLGRLFPSQGKKMPPTSPPSSPPCNFPGSRDLPPPMLGTRTMGYGPVAPGATWEHWRQAWQLALEPTQNLIASSTKHLCGGHTSAVVPRCVQQDKTLSSKCIDCLTCVAVLPGGDSAVSEHRLTGCVKETQSCHGAKAVGVRVGTNGQKTRRELGSMEAVGISAMSTALHYSCFRQSQFWHFIDYECLISQL